MLRRYYKHLKPSSLSLLFLQSNYLLPLLSFTSSTSPQSRTLYQCAQEANQIRSNYSPRSLIGGLIESRKYLQSLFLLKKIPISTTDFKQEPSVLTSICKACVYLWLRYLAFGLHGYLIKCGFGNWVDICSNLITMYVNFGDNEDAYKTFDEMPVKDEELCNLSVCCFVSSGFFCEGLSLYEKMVELGHSPSLKSISHAIMACGELKILEKGIWVHEFVRHNGLDNNILIGNLLISMYSKMGRLDLASSVFEDMPSKDIVTWNSMINGYTQKRNWEQAFKVFLLMKEVSHLAPNERTLLALVLTCGHAGNLDQGRSLHGHFSQTGLMSHFRISTATVDMYSKCGEIDSAQMLLEEGSHEKSLISWNTLISGYSQNGYCYEAVKLFKNMLNESNLKPDSVSFGSIIPAYLSLGMIESIKSIHSLLIKSGFEIGNDVVLGTVLVDAYGRCQDTNSANCIFSSIREPSVASWNSLVGAYCFNHQADLGMLCLLQMIRSEVSPDAITVLFLLRLCGEIGSLDLGSMAHGYTFVNGFSSHLDVGCTIIDTYLKCGCVENSLQFFRLMSVKNIVVWNTMLSGYARLGHYDSVMILFSEMQIERKSRPDSVTLVSLVQAYAALLGAHGGDIVHSLAIKLSFDSETSVMNALLDAYAKNGMIEVARSLFLQMDKLRDQCSWNVMIAGCGMHGQGVSACELLTQMEEEDGFIPDSITFTSLLSACNHSGLIGEGCKFFNLMVNKYNIEPSLEQWTCIINMLGRAGRLEEAYQLVASGQLSWNPNSAAVWGALLDACRTNMNLDLGKLVAKRLAKLEPENCGYYALLSNLYVLNKRWDEAADVRRLFDDHRLTKKPGLSLVQV